MNRHDLTARPSLLRCPSKHRLRLPVQFKADVLIASGAGMGAHALHKVKDALRGPSFLLHHGFDDLAGFRLAEPASAKEAFVVLVVVGDDPFTA